MGWRKTLGRTTITWRMVGIRTATKAMFHNQKVFMMKCIALERICSVVISLSPRFWTIGARAGCSGPFRQHYLIAYGCQPQLKQGTLNLNYCYTTFTYPSDILYTIAADIRLNSSTRIGLRHATQKQKDSLLTSCLEDVSQSLISQSHGTT